MKTGANYYARFLRDKRPLVRTWSAQEVVRTVEKAKALVVIKSSERWSTPVLFERIRSENSMKVRRLLGSLVFRLADSEEEVGEVCQLLACNKVLQTQGTVYQFPDEEKTETASWVA